MLPDPKIPGQSHPLHGMENSGNDFLETKKKNLLRFVIGLGFLSLFADFTYEGGRSIVGAYLATIGVGPIVVGVVAGFGELIGCGIQILSGPYADRTKRYWPLMSIGYILNLLSLPFLSMTSTLFPAMGLVFSERFGRGLRNPPRDTLLSQAGLVLGFGRVFGMHELMDQGGALLGPLAVSAAVAYGGYRLGFGILFIPAIIALILLRRGYKLSPAPDPDGDQYFPINSKKTYWFYLAFSGLTIMGFSHFIMIAYHLEQTHRVSPTTIPFLYSVAMALDAVVAFGAGRIFDRIGLKVLFALPFLILPCAPLLFLSRSIIPIILGVGFWGASMGMQESVMRAGISKLAPDGKRGSAYGVFNAFFGLSWLVGSTIMGILYWKNPADLVLFASVIQIIALAILWKMIANISAEQKMGSAS